MLYAEGRFGEFLYGDSSLTEEEVQEVRYWVNLARYVPEFVANLVEIAAIYDAQGYEIGRAAKKIEEVFDSQFVRKAPPWSLARWEEMLDITASEDDTEDQRRAAILAKIRSAQVCTPALIKAVTEEITGVECIVTEDTPHYSFTIKFIGQYGIVRSVRAVRRWVDERKPAHLVYTIEFRWVIWRDLLQWTWNDVLPYTWEGLLIHEIYTFVRWEGLHDQNFTWGELKKHTWKNIRDIEEAKT